VNLFLDASVVLAACGRPTGASRAVFNLASPNGWTLMTSPHVVSEVTRNLPRLPAQAAQDWAE
jgi:predicted nucleic acid-binding protein